MLRSWVLKKLAEVPYVYKFMSCSGMVTSEKTRLECLEDLILKKQLYFAKPSSFNDPFDCAPRVIEPESRKEWQRLYELYNIHSHFKMSAREYHEGRQGQSLADWLEEIRDWKGVSCFAEKEDEPLMWAHYADGHRGVAVKFPTDQCRWENTALSLLPVKYSKERPEYGLEVLERDKRWEGLFNLQLSKANSWAYEREWRCITIRGEPFRGGPGTWTIPDGMVSGIILGAKISPQHVEKITEWAERARIRVEKAVVSQERYAIEIRPM